MRNATFKIAFCRAVVQVRLATDALQRSTPLLQIEPLVWRVGDPPPVQVARMVSRNREKGIDLSVLEAFVSIRKNKQQVRREMA